MARILVLVWFLAVLPEALLAQTALMPRVRASDPSLVAAILEATTRSPTFSALVDRLQASDGIVYVARGRCGHGVRACLLSTVTAAADNRVLRILIDEQRTGIDLMSAIGHELQHAIEIVSDETVQSGADVYFKYRFTMRSNISRAFTFETEAAIIAGDRVRNELRARTRRDTSTLLE
jgi:hypothetical protein